MGKNIKGGKWSSKQSRLGIGISLDKFSKAKQSSFDRKKAKKDRHRALKAAKVNKYRKLKERLRTEGRLQPVLPTSITEETAEDADHYGDTQRAIARAGPAPEEDDSLDSEFVGEATPPLEDVATASHIKGFDLQEQEQLLHSGQTNLKQEAPKQAKLKKRRQKPQQEAQHAAGNVPDRGGDTVGSAIRLPRREPAQKRIELTDGDVRQQTERAAPMADSGQQHDSETPKAAKRKKKQKPPSQVQRLAERVDREKNEKRLAHEKAEQEAEEKQKHRAAMEKERKKRNKLFLKKTKRGQPVMKHRIDKVLEKLQAEQG